MFKVNNKYTRMTPWPRSSFFNVNFKHISHLVLVVLLWTLGRQIPTGSEFPVYICTNLRTVLPVLKFRILYVAGNLLSDVFP